jgi:hypothetical protein
MHATARFHCFNLATPDVPRQLFAAQRTRPTSSSNSIYSNYHHIQKITRLGKEMRKRAGSRMLKARSSANAHDWTDGAAYHFVRRRHTQMGSGPGHQGDRPDSQNNQINAKLFCLL